MTYTVSSGTLNSSIPYHTVNWDDFESRGDIDSFFYLVSKNGIVGSAFGNFQTDTGSMFKV